MAGEIDGYSLDKRFIRNDGDIVYVHMTIACYRVKGKVQFAIAGMLDITERKLAEESMQLASMVYQNSSEAMVVTDSDGEIITTNPAFTEITGYSLADVKGKSPPNCWYRVIRATMSYKTCYGPSITTDIGKVRSKSTTKVEKHILPY